LTQGRKDRIIMRMRRVLALAAILAALCVRSAHAAPFSAGRAADGSIERLARFPEVRAAAASPAVTATAAMDLARAFVLERNGLLGLEGIALGDAEPRTSPGGLHVVFPTVVADPSSPAWGLPVYLGEVAVHMGRDGEVLLVSNRPKGMMLAPEEPGAGAVVTAEEAVSRAIGIAGARGRLRGEPAAAKVAARTAGGWRRAWQVEVPAAAPTADFLVLLDEADGALLLLSDRLVRSQTGAGYVFDPQPITASGDPTLHDHSDVDIFRVERPLLEMDGTGYVQGRFVETSPTGTGRAHEPDSLRFFYTRNDPRFEEVMVYFHVDRFQRYLQEIGFDDANNRCISVDAHFTTEDNSYYDFLSRSLLFGDGGVDDAEDEEIIIHEYGHAIHHDIVPALRNVPATAEVRALSEGWSDYHAATYGGDPCVGEWDATSYSSTVPPCLRRTDNFKVYPRDLRGQIHYDGEIWSGALWAVHDSVGVQIADRLAIQSLYFTSGTTTMRDAGWALLLADWTLYGGAHLAAIEPILERRGLLPAGQEMILADDDAAKIGIGFGFRFLGTTYDSVWVSSNGALTFGDADASAAGDSASLAAGPPRISLFWTDLDPAAGSITFERAEAGFCVRFEGVAAKGETADSLDACVTLMRGSGDIQMEFSGAPAAGALVGVAAGGGAAPARADFLALPQTAPAAGAFQVFAHADQGPFPLAERVLRFSPRVEGGFDVTNPQVTAVAVTHFDATAEKRGIRLRWGLPDAEAVVGYRIARARGSEPASFLWEGLAAARGGENEYLDAGVEPGAPHSYWIHLVERTGGVTTIGPAVAIAALPALAITAPSPFTPGSSLRLALPAAARVALEVFDVQGRLVRTLHEGTLPQGIVEVAWDGRDGAGRRVSSGFYFARLRGEGLRAVGRVVLLAP
jgi:hypothetical protein